MSTCPYLSLSVDLLPFQIVTDFYTDHTIFSLGKLPRNKLNFNYVRRDRIASV